MESWRSERSKSSGLRRLRQSKQRPDELGSDEQIEQTVSQVRRPTDPSGE